MIHPKGPRRTPKDHVPPSVLGVVPARTELQRRVDAALSFCTGAAHCLLTENPNANNLPPRRYEGSVTRRVPDPGRRYRAGRGSAISPARNAMTPLERRVVLGAVPY